MPRARTVVLSPLLGHPKSALNVKSLCVRCRDWTGHLLAERGGNNEGIGGLSSNAALARLPGGAARLQ